MALYTVVIDNPDSATPLTFDVEGTGSVRWEATPEHNRGAIPIEQGAVRYRVLLERFALRANTPDLVVTALTNFLDYGIGKRKVPRFIQVKDAGGTPLPRFGNINTTLAPGSDTVWRDLALTRWELPAIDGQLAGDAEISLEWEATALYPDGNDVALLSQRYEEEEGEGGQATKRLTSVVRLVDATDTIPSALASSLRLAAPVGWVRSRGNNSAGYDLAYPLYPRTDHVETVSEVRRLTGGTVTAPAGAGSAEVETTLRDQPELGLRRTNTAARASGANDPAAWLASQRPAESVGLERTGAGDAVDAVGEWETVEAAAPAQKGRIVKVLPLYALRRQEDWQEVALSGNLLPILRRGPRRAPVLSEAFRVLALGASDDVLGDAPLPPALGLPWVLVLAEQGLPRVVEWGGAPAQHLWERTTTRTYLYAGDGDPLGDAALLARLGVTYEGGSGDLAAFLPTAE